jgi:hypothetical protein
VESKKVQIPAVGMPEMSETQLDTTTNHVGGKNKKGNIHPHFAHCLVFVLICLDWFLVSLHSLVTNSASMPLEVPCCPLEDRVHQGLEKHWISWYGEKGEFEDDDWKEVEEQLSLLKSLGIPTPRNPHYQALLISLVWPTPLNYPVTKYLASQEYNRDISLTTTIQKLKHNRST